MISRFFRSKLSLLICFLLTQAVFAQKNIASTLETDMIRAKAYLLSAKTQYNNGNYEKALEYCRRLEEFTEDIDPEVEALKIKSYYGSKDYSKAKISLDLFLRLNADRELTEEMLPFIVYIDDKIEEENLDFEDARESGMVVKYEKYLEKYPSGRFVHEAERLMKEQIERDSWIRAKQTGTTKGFYHYISIYPNGSYVMEAQEEISKIDKQAYDKALAGKSQKSLNEYLQSFPKGEFRGEVEEKLKEQIEEDTFSVAGQSGRLNDYINYVDEYPTGRFLREANNKIEEMLYSSGTNAFESKDFYQAKVFFDQYESRFPGGRFIVDVQKKLKKCNRKSK